MTTLEMSTYHLLKKMILSKDELHALEDSLMLLSTYNQVKIENDNSVSCNELHEKIKLELLRRQWH